MKSPFSYSTRSLFCFQIFKLTLYVPRKEQFLQEDSQIYKDGVISISDTGNRLT
jgi:hypothetical protein